MRRLFSVLLCFIILISTYSLTASAATMEDQSTYPNNEILISQEIKELSDGTSLVITVSQLPNTSRAVKSVSGTKTYSGRNGDGVIMWQFKVHGTFSVNSGVSATCTAVSHSYSLPDDDWNYVEGSSYKTGNKAIGHGKFNRKLLFVTVETKECDVTLSCDVNGNLS